MPYIRPYDRFEITPEHAQRKPVSPGELNFLITTCVSDYLEHHSLSYENINAVIGVLECAKLELYRRVAVPYEDGKLRENGDVYPPHLTVEL